MRSTSGIFGAFLVAVSVLALAGCKKKEQSHPPPLVEEPGGKGGALGGGDTAGANAGGDTPVVGGAGGEPAAEAGTSAEGGSAGEGGTTEVGGALPGGAPPAGGAAPGGGEPGGAGVAGSASPGGAGAAVGGVGGFAGAVVVTGGQGGAEPGAPAEGDPCTDSAECPSNQICYRGITWVGSCRRWCSPESVGTGIGCNGGEICTLDDSGTQPACLDLCAPFSESDPCPETEWCMPYPQTGFTNGTVVDGLCTEEAPGAAVGGESCETEGAAACASGLQCYDAPGVMLGFDTCEPVCSIVAAEGDPLHCGEGAVCRAAAGDMSGVCITLCDPFGPVTCGAGEHCVAYQDWVDDAVVVEGHCVQSGTVAQGDACAPGECGAGLDCVPEPPPFGAERTCRATCDVAATGTCGTAATCVPVAEGSSGVGTCEPDCAAFEVGEDAGCAAGEWCAPTYLGGEAAICVEAGSAAAGEDCYDSTDCAAGAFCDCRYGANELCFQDQRCEPACVPGAGAAEAGGCPSGQTCVSASIWGTTASFGLCRATCDVDGDATCPDAEETCVGGALLPGGVDACIDIPRAPSGTSWVGQYCIFGVGVDTNDPCGATDLCAILPAETPGDAAPTCVDACRFSEGALGTSGHPDCADPAATCEELAPDLPYGHCVTPA
jgi:hypothetical protein